MTPLLLAAILAGQPLSTDPELDALLRWTMHERAALAERSSERVERERQQPRVERRDADDRRFVSTAERRARWLARRYLHERNQLRVDCGCGSLHLTGRVITNRDLRRLREAADACREHQRLRAER